MHDTRWLLDTIRHTVLRLLTAVLHEHNECPWVQPWWGWLKVPRKPHAMINVIVGFTHKHTQLTKYSPQQNGGSFRRIGRVYDAVLYREPERASGSLAFTLRIVVGPIPLSYTLKSFSFTQFVSFTLNIIFRSIFFRLFFFKRSRWELYISRYSSIFICFWQTGTVIG